MNKYKIKEQLLIIENLIDEEADGDPRELAKLMDQREKLEIKLDEILYPNQKINDYWKRI